MVKSALFVLTALLLAGCAGAGTTFVHGRSMAQVEHARSAGLLPYEQFSYFAANKDLYTRVYGNPFDIPDAAFTQTVTDILDNRNTANPANFTTTPGPSADTAYELVMVFNPTSFVSGRDICRIPDALPTDPGKRPIRIAMAFCLAGGDLTSLQGTIPPADGPTDPRFSNAIAQALAVSTPTSTSR